MNQLVFVLFLVPAIGFAQTYSIDWSKITGGGGSSSNDQYSVSGTIGQPDAGQMLGGNYSLTGGFWSIVSAVQTPAAPSLTIVNMGADGVKVLWPNPSAGWVLQQCNDLDVGDWSDSSLSQSVEGSNLRVTTSPPSGTLFFRLQKP